MASKVLLELKVDDKGSLKIVEKEAKSAASATDRLSKKTRDLEKARNRYHKQEKGVGQAGLSSAKSFSKLNQTIGSGSSGLVGAYAVLAANVFAATAAFGVFQRAAQFDDLIRGLEFVGNAAGRNLPEVSKRLKEITNSAISTESAMRATALATGAGFSVEQLEGLTKIAKGASIALGRDLTDALDRLVRGTAKLEPEILDELGIMVRLDTAVQNYASALGKNADALTDFERRQAFLNETLKQGEKKYFDVADAIDTNPYDKLAASLSNLQKSLIGFVNNTLKLNVAIDFFANNIAALTGVATLFGSTLLRSITPALFNLDAAAASSAAAFAAQRLSMLDSIGVAEKMPKRYEEALAPIREGVGSTEDFAKATESLAASDKKYTSLKKNQQKVLERTQFLETKNNARKENLKATQESLIKLQQAAIAGNKKDVKTIIEGNKALQTRFGGTRNLVKSLEQADQAQLKAIGSGKEFELAQGKIDKIINKTEKSITGYGRAIEASEKSIEGYSTQIAINGQRVGELDEVQKAQTASTARHTRATAIQQAATGSLFGAFSTLKQSMKEENETQKRNTESKGKAAKAAGLLRVGLFGASGGVRILLAGFASLLPFLGIFISVGTVLFSFLKDKFFPEDVVKNRIDEATESFKSFADIQQQYQNTVAGSENELGNAYIAYSGVLDQIKSKLSDITSFTLDNVNAQISNVLMNLGKTQARLNQLGREDTTSTASGPGTRRANRKSVSRRNERSRLLKEESALEKELIELNEQKVIAQVNGFQAVAKSALDELKVRMNIAKQQKDAEGNRATDPFGLAITERHFKSIANIQASVSAGTKSIMADTSLDADTRNAAIQELINNANTQMLILNNEAGNIAAAFKGVETSVAEANKVINKQMQATKEPFEEIQNAVAGVASNFKSASDRVKELEAIQRSGKKLTPEQNEELNEQRQILIELGKTIDGLNIAEEFKTGADGLKAFDDEIIRFRKRTKELRSEIAVMASENKEFAAVAKSVAGTESIVIANNNELLRKKLELVKEEIGEQTKLLGKEKENTEKITKLEAERKKLNAEIVGEVELAAIKRRAELTDLKNAQALEAARLTTMQKRAKLEAVIASPGGQLSPAKQFELDMLAADAKIQATEAEVEGAKLRLEIERAILETRFKDPLSRDGEAFSQGEKDVLALLDKQMGQTIAIGKEKIKQARIDKQALIATTGATASGFNVDNLPPQQAAIIKGQQQVQAALAAQNAAQTGLNNLQAQQIKNVEAVNAAAAKYSKSGSQEDLSALKSASQALSDTQTVIFDQEKLVEASRERFKQSQLQNTVAVLQGTAEAFRAMGPEGELGAALASASATMIGSINSSLEILEKTEGKGAEATQARIAMAGAAISAFGSIAAAASNQRISAIDREIEAEKKRDGKSKDSLAKIKALEGKKDAMARKAFERNKKIQMASTVINTASAIMGILANESAKIGLGAIVLSALVGAMGAAQLAIIAGQSYQGGASSTGTAGMPTGITVGSRGNSVDVGRSRSARGELAYLRGAEGTGGPESFKPAFYGSRMRATGGETTGYMVGEQGPELFIPDRPGTVVSNDDVADTIATPVNATFNINTIDASGVEDILVSQRGNIIGMIREGANSYGQGFLEEVDTSIYTPSAGGVSRY